MHYLKTPPFICTGYQYKHEHIFRDLIEANKRRFLAAYVVDGWLCTHAGVHEGLAKSEMESVIADRLNNIMKEYLERPYEPGPEGIFAIGAGRKGESRCGGTFWFDFIREKGLDVTIKQIFGHTETPEPVIVPKSYVALDTTNNENTVYLFDTQSEALVELPMSPTSRKHYSQKRCRDCQNIVDYLNDDGTCTDCGSSITNRYPRIRDLPKEEREPFEKSLYGQTCPCIPGIDMKDQDSFYMHDYEQWKRRQNSQKLGT